MHAFHAALREGVANDEALRRATVAVERNAATAPPFHWAAFLLVGDLENHRLGLGLR